VEPEAVVEILRGVLSKFNEVKLAYLFGSYAWGKAMPISDLDIALLIEQRKAIPHLMAELSKALNIPEGKISILDLEAAPPTLTLRILKKGIKLLDREKVHEEQLREKVPVEVIDIMENERTDFQMWLRGNPLDETLLKRIITQLSEDVNDLREILGEKRLEDLRLDKNLRKAFERTLHTSIEGATDLLRHIISGLNLGVAEYYRDYVEICRERGVISHKTAEGLLELIPTRHMLIHRYRELDHSKLWIDAKKMTETWPIMQQEIKRYLQEERRQDTAWDG